MTIFQIIAVSVMLALLAYFIFKHRRNIPQIDGGASAENSGIWLERWAYLPEFLSVALTLAWAYSAQRGAIMPYIFCGGFIAFVAFRAIGVPRAVDSFSAAKIGTGAVLSLLAIGSLFVLFSTSVFDLANNADNEVQARLESSKPALALDTEIQQTHEKIAALAAYSDASKADNETQANKQENDRAAQEQTALYTKLARLEAALKKCPANFFTNCINPKIAKIDSINVQLQQISTGTFSTYAVKNSEYLGLKNHLLSLQKQRANLSDSGEGVQSAYKKEDRLIGDFFGISFSEAASIKWLVFAAVFDLLALLARVGGALLNPSDQRAIIRKKVNAMIDLGIDPLANINSPKHAQVELPKAAAMPALRTGGRIVEDGVYTGHKNEIVLNEAATNFIDNLLVGWLDKVNNGVFEVPDFKPVTVITERHKGGVFQCSECGNDYTAKHKNHYQCSDCSSTQKKDFKHKHC